MRSRELGSNRSMNVMEVLVMHSTAFHGGSVSERGDDHNQVEVREPGKPCGPVTRAA